MRCPECAGSMTLLESMDSLLGLAKWLKFGCEHCGGIFKVKRSSANADKKGLKEDIEHWEEMWDGEGDPSDCGCEVCNWTEEQYRKAKGSYSADSPNLKERIIDEMVESKEEEIVREINKENPKFSRKYIKEHIKNLEVGDKWL